MIKQKLFLDFDGVLVNSTKSFVDVYNKLTGEKADWTKVNQWNFIDQCPQSNMAMVFKIFAMKEFFEGLELYDEYTLKVFNALREKYEILITTIGTPMNIALKTMWIAENLAHDNMLLLSQSHGIVSKSIVDMTGGILMDDHEDNLFTSKAETNISFGVRRSWNENWKGDICLTWEEVADMLL